MAQQENEGSGKYVGMGEGERYFRAVIFLLHNGVKSKAVTWLQILQYPYAHICTISFDVQL